MKKSLYSLWSILFAAVLVFLLAGCPGIFNPDDAYSEDDISALSSAVTVLPAGTTGSNGTKSMYVQFGYWPQTIKDKSVTIDESASVTYGCNTYYLGSDGNLYAKCLENGQNKTKRDKYSNHTSVKLSKSNSYQYFKVEPIKWRVLDENFNNTGRLLVAENIVMSDIPYYENSGKNSANNYQNSQIRAYLNGITYTADNTTDADKWTNIGFLQSAFTASAQDRIITTTVSNTSESNPYACDDTKDKVFLLSEAEITKYIKGESRIRKPTDYALANHCWMDNNSGGHWWLRTPRANSSKIALSIFGDDDIYDNDEVNADRHGVVPAIVVSY